MKKYKACFVAAMFATGFMSGGASAEPVDQQLAHAVAGFSADACYGVVSGAITLPGDQEPNSISKTMDAVAKMGLKFGVSDRVLKELGKLGLMMVSQAVMGSKELAHGDVVVSIGGRQPGCRVILLADAENKMTDAVSDDLTRAGWTGISKMAAQQGPLERRAFIRRDSQRRPYLMNLWTVADPGSRIRLFTTTIPIPPNVVIPKGS